MSMNEYFRRLAFAEAVAAYGRNPHEPPLSITVRSHKVSIADVCEAIVADQGEMPEYLARDLNVVAPATYAKGASILKQYLRLPTLGV
jgi:hypothetical protein